MPTPLECAKMCKEAAKEDGGVPPNDWYTYKTYYPTNNWGIGLSIYEKIIDFDTGQDEDCLPYIEVMPDDIDMTESKREILGNQVVTCRVEWVIAFRSTKNILNVLSNLMFFLGNRPPGTYDILVNDIYNHETQWITESQLVGQSNPNVLYLLRKIEELIKQFIPKSSLIRKNMRITFVGHSFGAVTAELCGSRLACSFPDGLPPYEIKIITFDSLGCSTFMEPVEREWSNGNTLGEPNVINYVGAPNLVNTEHTHVGKLIRLQSNINNSSISKLIHCTSCVGDSISRVYLWQFILNALKITSKTIVPMPENPKPYLLMFSLYIVIKRLVAGYNYTSYQHSIDNMIKLLAENNNEIEISQWPSFRQYYLYNTLKKLFFFPAPGLPIKHLPYGNRGIFTLFSENKITENKTRATPGYRERQITNYSKWYMIPRFLTSAIAASVYLGYIVLMVQYANDTAINNISKNESNHSPGKLKFW